MNKGKIEIQMLGNFGVKIDGTNLVFPYEKAKLLFAYLIAEDMPVCRAHLATMLWPTKSEYHAHQNLRQALTAIKRVCGEHFTALFNVNKLTLEFTRSSCCEIDIDKARKMAVKVHECDEMVCDGSCQQAMEIYRGEFCQGIRVPPGGVINDWLDSRRDEYRAYAVACARELIACLKQSRLLTQALAIYRQAIAIDKSDEQLTHEYMQLLVECGQRSRAIRLYREYENRLEDASGMRLRPDKRLWVLFESLFTKETTD